MSHSCRQQINLRKLHYKFQCPKLTVGAGFLCFMKKKNKNKKPLIFFKKQQLRLHLSPDRSTGIDPIPDRYVSVDIDDR